ncbi:hypothetical protein SNEBB_008510 [Seison nebaliae]|nr:hypothetical protein SNEBB_008510 [Seison nebaliae]
MSSRRTTEGKHRRLYDGSSNESCEKRRRIIDIELSDDNILEELKNSLGRNNEKRFERIINYLHELFLSERTEKSEEIANMIIHFGIQRIYHQLVTNENEWIKRLLNSQNSQLDNDFENLENEWSTLPNRFAFDYLLLKCLHRLEIDSILYFRLLTIYSLDQWMMVGEERYGILLHFIMRLTNIVHFYRDDLIHFLMNNLLEMLQEKYSLSIIHLILLIRNRTVIQKELRYVSKFQKNKFDNSSNILIDFVLLEDENMCVNVEMEKKKYFQIHLSTSSSESETVEMECKLEKDETIERIVQILLTSNFDRFSTNQKFYSIDCFLELFSKNLNFIDFSNQLSILQLFQSIILDILFEKEKNENLIRKLIGKLNEFSVNLENRINLKLIKMLLLIKKKDNNMENEMIVKEKKFNEILIFLPILFGIISRIDELNRDRNSTNSLCSIKFIWIISKRKFQETLKDMAKSSDDNLDNIKLRQMKIFANFHRELKKYGDQIELEKLERELRMIRLILLSFSNFFVVQIFLHYILHYYLTTYQLHVTNERFERLECQFISFYLMSLIDELKDRWQFKSTEELFKNISPFLAQLIISDMKFSFHQIRQNEKKSIEEISKEQLKRFQWNIPMERQLLICHEYEFENDFKKLPYHQTENLTDLLIVLNFNKHFVTVEEYWRNLKIYLTLYSMERQSIYLLNELSMFLLSETDGNQKLILHIKFNEKIIYIFFQLLSSNTIEENRDNIVKFLQYNFSAILIHLVSVVVGDCEYGKDYVIFSLSSLIRLDEKNEFNLISKGKLFSCLQLLTSQKKTEEILELWELFGKYLVRFEENSENFIFEYFYSANFYFTQPNLGIVYELLLDYLKNNWKKLERNCLIQFHLIKWTKEIDCYLEKLMKHLEIPQSILERTILSILTDRKYEKIYKHIMTYLMESLHQFQLDKDNLYSMEFHQIHERLVELCSERMDESTKFHAIETIGHIGYMEMSVRENVKELTEEVEMEMEKFPYLHSYENLNESPEILGEILNFLIEESYQNNSINVRYLARYSIQEILKDFGYHDALMNDDKLKLNELKRNVHDWDELFPLLTSQFEVDDSQKVEDYVLEYIDLFDSSDSFKLILNDTVVLMSEELKFFHFIFPYSFFHLLSSSYVSDENIDSIREKLSSILEWDHMKKIDEIRMVQNTFLFHLKWIRRESKAKDDTRKLQTIWNEDDKVLPYSRIFQRQFQSKIFIRIAKFVSGIPLDLLMKSAFHIHNYELALYFNELGCRQRVLETYHKMIFEKLRSRMNWSHFHFTHLLGTHYFSGWIQSKILRLKFTTFQFKCWDGIVMEEDGMNEVNLYKIYSSLNQYDAIHQTSIDDDHLETEEIFPSFLVLKVKNFNDLTDWFDNRLQNERNYKTIDTIQSLLADCLIRSERSAIAVSFTRNSTNLYSQFIRSTWQSNNIPYLLKENFQCITNPSIDIIIGKLIQIYYKKENVKKKEDIFQEWKTRILFDFQNSQLENFDQKYITIHQQLLINSHLIYDMKLFDTISTIEEKKEENLKELFSTWNYRSSHLPLSMYSRQLILNVHECLLICLRESNETSQLIQFQLGETQLRLSESYRLSNHQELCLKKLRNIRSDSKIILLKKSILIAKCYFSQNKKNEAISLLKNELGRIEKEITEEMLKDEEYSKQISQIHILLGDYMSNLSNCHFDEVFHRYESAVNMDRKNVETKYIFAKYHEKIARIYEESDCKDEKYTYYLNGIKNYCEALSITSDTFAKDCIMKAFNIFFQIAEEFIQEKLETDVLLKETLVMDLKGQEQRLINFPQYKFLVDCRDIFLKQIDSIPSTTIIHSVSILNSRFKFPLHRVFEVIAIYMSKLYKEMTQQTLWLCVSLNYSKITLIKTRQQSILTKLIQKHPQIKQEHLNIYEISKHLKQLAISDIAARQFSMEVKFGKIYKSLNRSWLPEIIIPNFHQLTHPLSNPIYINGVEEKFSVLSSLARPKRIKFIGSDGNKYAYLCKKDEGIRTDHRQIEVNYMMNEIFQRDDECRKRALSLRVYAVIFIDHNSGLIEWIYNLKTLKTILDAKYLDVGIPNATSFGAMRMTDLERKPEKQRKIEFLTKVLPHFLPSQLPIWFFELFDDPKKWYSFRCRFTYTCAVTSIMGYIGGLGDRHLANILLDTVTGQVIHVDFSCMFNAANDLPVPECVPFRLTHNLVDAFGCTGYNGIFRSTAERTFELMEKNDDAILTILRSFIYDPCIGWKSKKGRNQTNNVATIGNELAKEFVTNVENRLNGKIDKQLSSIEFPSEKLIQHLIDEATSYDNLSKMFHGWAPFI